MCIRLIDWQDTIAIRHQVLWPHKAPAFSKVDNDEQGLHFGAFIGETLVGVASVFIEGHRARLRKYATLSDFQGQGIGSQVLNAIFAELKRYPVSYFWCDARESAIGFYQRFGMQVESERFYKSAVAYVKMGCALPDGQTN
ncbi:GNAT family N-acetyltransferase [Oceanisphaera avium]|uniref:GNAT family N-acetyltransferase n=1 Tax=Oceanisphaera avium TaxID=1903694 RepID=A0A1Y0D138_9GAMM|nr:GNAT family N-acetyltransferase [Oceanisphaera avium]